MATFFTKYANMWLQIIIRVTFIDFVCFVSSLSAAVPKKKNQAITVLRKHSSTVNDFTRKIEHRNSSY